MCPSITFDYQDCYCNNVAVLLLCCVCVSVCLCWDVCNLAVSQGSSVREKRINRLERKVEGKRAKEM